MRRGVIALWACAAVFAAPAVASAATTVYGGTTDGGGKIAMDVKLSKKGVPKKITELRGVELPSTCDISGGPVPLNVSIPAVLKISKQGKFSYSYTDPTYGNTSSISGKFVGRKDKKIKGEFVYANHYPADDKYPEESCHTDELGYKVKRGGADVEVPASPAARPLR